MIFAQWSGTVLIWLLQKKKLERIQKRFASICHFRCSHHLYVYLEVLKSLQISELATRRCSRDLVFLFKCIHSYFNISSFVSSVHYHIPGRYARNHRTFHVDPTDFMSPSGRIQNYFNHLDSSDIDIFNTELCRFKKCLRRVCGWCIYVGSADYFVIFCCLIFLIFLILNLFAFLFYY